MSILAIAYVKARSAAADRAASQTKLVARERNQLNLLLRCAA
jgi:hypothetical protein